MKTAKILFVAAAILASSAASAAPRARSESSVSKWYKNRPSVDAARLNLGVHFGPNFSTASVDSSQNTLPDTSGRTRLAGGITSEINLVRWFAIQPELNFMQRGAEVTYPQQPNTRVTYSLDYLEIPLFAKARYEVIDGLRPFFMTGPSIGFVIGKSGNTVGADGREQKLPSNDINNRFQTVNFSWNFGLGTDIDLGKQWSLVLDTRYAIGMSNILTNRGQGGDRDASTSLSGFQILAGIKTSML